MTSGQIEIHETDEVADLAEPYCPQCQRYVDIDELRVTKGCCPGCNERPRLAVPLVALGKTPVQVVTHV